MNDKARKTKKTTKKATKTVKKETPKLIVYENCENGDVYVCTPETEKHMLKEWIHSNYHPEDVENVFEITQPIEGVVRIYSEQLRIEE